MTLPEISEEEERIAFCHELGVAITEWASIERSMCAMASVLIGQTNNENQITKAFFSIENFRSKTSFIDALVEISDSSYVSKETWALLQKKVTKVASLRNRIAHGQMIRVFGAPIGRRFAIVPPRIKWRSFGLGISQNGSVPDDAIFIRDLMQAATSFIKIASAIYDASFVFSGNSALRQESLEQEENQMTMDEVEIRIHAIFGRQPQPSRRQQLRELDALNAHQSLQEPSDEEGK